MLDELQPYLKVLATVLASTCIPPRKYLREKVPFVESLPFPPCFSTEPF